MKSSYKRLGDYIQVVNFRNKDLENLPLMGLSVSKVFFPTIANLVGTDMSTYKIVYKNQFTYIADTSRRGDKIAIALNDKYDKMLVSQAYTPFEVIDESKLLPEYLMMWFRRPEFDRYARFKSHGSAREIFDWNEMCEVELPIPSIEKQQEIVQEYHTIQNRIALNNQLISKLEETAQAIYKEWFVDGIDLENLPYGWKIKMLSEIATIKGGKRLPKGEELNDLKLGRPYVKVADMKKTKYLVLNNKFQYVSNDIQSLISRYIINTGDLIISIVGTVGMINIIDDSLNNANLTENCFKINAFKLINANYLYHYLNSEIGMRVIEERTVGGVQGKLPMYNVDSMPILIPEENLLNRFNIIIVKIDKTTLNKVKENKILEELKDLLLAKMTRVESEKELIQ
jgi:type I restriction enzyme S subunit